MEIPQNLWYRINYLRLLNSQDLSARRDSLFLVKNTCLNILSNVKLQDKKINEAIFLFEKTLFNTESIFYLLGGVKTNTFNCLPIESLSMIARNTLESYTLFNNIYISHKEDESNFLYYIWIIASLNKRQSYTIDSASPASLTEKRETERKQLDEYKENIKRLSIYSKYQQIIDHYLQNGNFYAYEKQFKNDKIENYTNINRLVEIGFNKEIFDKAYPIFSTTSHPTNASVFMYLGYRDNIDSQLDLAATILNFCTSLLSSFLYDFIVLFPELKEKFKAQPELNQLIIDAYNSLCRGPEYKLSTELVNLFD